MNKIIVENDTMRFYSTPVPIPVGGSQWSKIFFMFSDEWEELRKIAQFRQGELKRNVDIDSNNFCYVPNEMLPDMCGELSIVGYPQDTASAVIATANSLMLNFVQGFESGGEPAVPPTPDLYQKLIKEFAEKQQSDWNQNDEAAQDYIKNRTHWKEENTEKYEKLKLTSYLQDGRVHFYSLGGQIRFGGEVDFSVYPFSLRYGGDPIYSDKIPLTTLLLTSLAYTSCSGMSVYDEKEQLIGHFQFDALTFTAANDTYYTTVLLEVPYNYDTAYTVVLELKPVYHKIPQEYLPEIVLYSEQTLTNKQQAQARTNIGAGQPVFAVNVTSEEGEDGRFNYTADKTAAEIEAAYQAGRTIVCRWVVPWVLPVELPLKSRMQERVFIFAVDQLANREIYTISVIIRDSGVEPSVGNTNIYEKPTSGIPKSDLAEDVQTSLDKADTAISLGLTAATPGQIIKVKTVQDGKPTEWEAVDMPSGDKWEKIKEITIAEGAEESNALTINADENGNTFRLKKARLYAKFPAYTGTSTIPNYSFAMINGKAAGRVAPLLYTGVWPKISTKNITGTIYYVDVSGAQQIEHSQMSGTISWSDDTNRDYRTYGSTHDQLRIVYGDTLWAKPITSIGGSTMLIYPGCHFVLYGVRE